MALRCPTPLNYLVVHSLIASRFNGDIDFLTLEVNDLSTSIASKLTTHAHHCPINFLQCEQMFVISASEDRSLKVCTHFTFLLTLLLIKSFTHSLTHLLTKSFTHSIFNSLNPSLSHSSTYSLNHSITH